MWVQVQTDTSLHAACFEAGSIASAVLPGNGIARHAVPVPPHHRLVWP